MKRKPVTEITKPVVSKPTVSVQNPIPTALLKPQNILAPKTNWIIAFSVFITTLIVYLLTNARTMSFWDSGEYATCISILGIPHPPGNPFYIFIGRAFAVLAHGIPHALVASSMSSFMGAFSVMFVYLYTVKIVSMFDKSPFRNAFAGLMAALLSAYSFTFWTNSIEAEVNVGILFVDNLIIYLTMLWVEKSEDLNKQNILLLITYIFFLGFCIHQTSLQIAPAVLFVVVYPMLIQSIKNGTFWIRTVAYVLLVFLTYVLFKGFADNLQIPDLGKYAFLVIVLGLMYYHLHEKIENRVWLMGILMVVIGLSPHIFLLVRSQLRPFVNEGNPHNLPMFLDYVLRRQYGVTSFMERRATFGYQMDFHFLRYFGWQWFDGPTIANWFHKLLNPNLTMASPEWLNTYSNVIKIIGNLIISLLGFFGIYHIANKNKHAFAYFFSFFFMASLAMVFVMNLSDAEVRDRDYFFNLAYNLWAIWMAIGAIGLLQLVEKKKIAVAVVAVLLFALPVVNMVSQYKVHDRSQEFLALDYGMNFLNTLEKNAIIFTNGDNDTFPLWYNQAVKDPNAKEVVHPERNTYPDNEALSAMKTAMEFKNNSLNGIRKDVTIANLSLLNTPWYWHQLEDHEGVLFNMAADEIDNISPIQLPQDMHIEIKGPKPGMNFTINYKKGQILYVKDLAVIQIIKENYGKRPIYFAVTCAELTGFDNHLQNVGMADRIVAKSGQDMIDGPTLEQNATQVYSYRSIEDTKVYKDDNMTRLINNYGAAFMRLSRYYHNLDNLPMAKKYMERALHYIDDKSRFYMAMATMYSESKDVQKTDSLLQLGLASTPNDPEKLQQAAFISFNIGKNDQALTYLEKAYRVILEEPNEQLKTQQMTDLGVFIYRAMNSYSLGKRAEDLLGKIEPYLQAPEPQQNSQVPGMPLP
jgi:tetratricopeptide (TPR) repeat protein